VQWLVPGLTLTKSKINSGELTDKYQIFCLSWGRVIEAYASTECP